MWKLKVGLCVLALGFCSPAWADNTTVAEALFDSGKQLYDQGKYAEACEKFAESQRLDPGTGTLLNLASCYEKAGRRATAWSTYRLAASSAASAGQEDRAEHARDQAAQLESNLARVTLEIAPEAKVEGLIILQDGQEQTTAVAGVALPVDAGVHRWEVSAPGHQGWRTELTIADGEQKVVKIPALIRDGETGPKEEKVKPVPEEKGSGGGGTVEDSGSGSSMKTWGYVLSGVGVVGIGAGSIFGIMAISKNSKSNDSDLCNGNRCTREGVDLRDQARAMGTVSTIAFGVGIAALGAGVTMLVLAPSKNSQVGVSPMPGGGRLLLSGVF